MLSPEDAKCTKTVRVTLLSYFAYMELNKDSTDNDWKGDRDSKQESDHLYL